MSRLHSHLNSAATILHLYRGDQPFNLFLKTFFSQQKKYGSRDRKQIAHLCYSYFRLGQALQQLPTEERILAGLFLCEQGPNEFLEQLKPEWNELSALPPDQKSSMLNFSIKEIFPWGDNLSEGIDHHDLAASFLVQPNLFLRLRPRHEEDVKQKLQGAGLLYTEVMHQCLLLDNAVQVDKVITLDEEAVVQDFNSQRVGEFLKIFPVISALKVYDCCAASGGKSILAYDVLKNIELTVSDIRESILSNLKKRFARAGIENYSAFVIDLSLSYPRPESFDLVICDAPCTGSGTWSRTPEQLYYFSKERIAYYSELQRSILQNIFPVVKEGGYILYITCSVFRKENEEAVKFLEEELNMRLEKMNLLKGYGEKADTLFAALVQKKGRTF